LRETVVYVIGPRIGPQKIGIAIDAKSRLDALQTGCPFNLTIHHTTPPLTERAARKAEILAHRLLRAFRQRGEWFNVTPERAIEVVQVAITSSPGEDEPAAALTLRAMHDTGMLTFREYEAAAAYQEVRKEATRSQYGVIRRNRESLERRSMAAALLRKIDAQVSNRCEADGLTTLIHVCMRGAPVTGAGMEKLREALDIVSHLLDTTTSAKAA
jgi:hypothetical protein